MILLARTVTRHERSNPITYQGVGFLCFHRPAHFYHRLLWEIGSSLPPQSWEYWLL